MCKYFLHSLYIIGCIYAINFRWILTNCLMHERRIDIMQTTSIYWNRGSYNCDYIYWWTSQRHADHLRYDIIDPLRSISHRALQESCKQFHASQVTPRRWELPIIVRFSSGLQKSKIWRSIKSDVTRPVCVLNISS